MEANVDSPGASLYRRVMLRCPRCRGGRLGLATREVREDRLSVAEVVTTRCSMCGSILRSRLRVLAAPTLRPSV